MAKFNKDSFGGTVAVVLAVSLICSVVVASAVVSLKPVQAEQKLLDKQRNILNVAGLLQEDTNVPQVYKERIEARVVDLATGDYVKDLDRYDMRIEVKKPEQTVAIQPEADFAGLKHRTKYAEVYLVKTPQGKVDQVVLPVYGTGLWSVMYGFVAVQTDGNTINGITYYDHGETPGLGGEIANPLWQQRFVGKKLYDQQGSVAIRIAKGASADAEHGVDALSGASMTTKGVQGTFKYWFSQNGFAPYLSKLKAGEL